MRFGKAELLSIGIPWIITVGVAATLLFNTRRDIYDFVLVAILIVLSGRRTYLYFTKKKAPVPKS